MGRTYLTRPQEVTQFLRWQQIKSQNMGLPAMPTNFPTHMIGNTVDHDRIKRVAYHDHRMVVASLDHPSLNWVDREELARIANKIYGKPPTLQAERPRR